MAATAQTVLTTTVTDTAGGTLTIANATGNTFNLGVGNAAVDQEVSLTNGVFTALTVPSGAKAVRLRLGGAVSLVLKGVTGDTGIPISPSVNPLTDDLYLTLGASPSVGILNNGASPVTIRAIWM